MDSLAVPGLGGLAALTAIWGCVQFAGKIREAHALGLSLFNRGFYDFYVGERIKGFTSHWNTFSAEEMFALIMLAAFLLFARAPRSWIWLKAACVFLIALAVLLAETRGVWFATAAAGFYLLWVWKRKLLLLAPVAIVLAVVASPPAIRNASSPSFSRRRWTPTSSASSSGAPASA